eukprot:12430439-Karenia_brevis.AAC.1
MDCITPLLDGTGDMEGLSDLTFGIIRGVRVNSTLKATAGQCVGGDSGDTTLGTKQCGCMKEGGAGKMRRGLKSGRIVYEGTGWCQFIDPEALSRERGQFSLRTFRPDGDRVTDICRVRDQWGLIDLDEQYRGCFGPRVSISGDPDSMLDPRDCREVPCQEWPNEMFFEARERGALEISQCILDGIERWGQWREERSKRRERWESTRELTIPWRGWDMQEADGWGTSKLSQKCDG